MKTKNFGITIDSEQLPEGVDARECAARLFASPQVTVEQAKKVLTALDAFQKDKFFEITDRQIKDVIERQNNGAEIARLYGDKLQKWIEHFGLVSVEDLIFLQEKFAIKKEHFERELQMAISRSINSPKAMANVVKQYVKGQDPIIERASVPFYQHLESMRSGTTSKIKTAFTLVGNTGVGKTEILRRYCQIINVPIVRINTSDCVPNGWRGQKISDHIGFNINNEEDLERMKYGVIVFSEFDKICHYDKKMLGSNSSDWDADMQRDFLKFFDKGYELPIERTQGSETKSYRLPTDNLLLCFDGAFSGIEKIIEKRLNLRSRVGFNQPQEITTGNLLQRLQVCDLEKWGYMPELLGRIGKFFVLNPMTEELVYEIITTASENILEAHKEECRRLGIKLEFGDDALKKISKKAFDTGLGARSVKSVLSDLLENVYYECDKYKNSTLHIDSEYISREESKNHNLKQL